jgi:DNA-binding NtrC family response regulator
MTREVLYIKPVSAHDSLRSHITSGGWDVHVAPDASRARQLMGERDFRVGLAHWQSDDRDSLHAQMQELAEVRPGMNWIALLSKSSEQLKRLGTLIGEYFYDFHTLPADLERLLTTLGHAYGMAQLTPAACRAPSPEGSTDQMVGASPAMQELHRNVDKVAAVNVPVLISGETGTGKELTALAIHKRSSSCGGPFVALNCGAIPANLIQSELFGHERGSFTGAERRRVGRIESARRGTVFLDEIGDLSPELQTNLLRFLQEKTIDRVGGAGPIHIDVRVVAATHVNLEEAVKQKKFREDLYYRLNVLHINVPPLRDRAGDVELLAEVFLQKFAKERGNYLQGFNQHARDLMMSYSWPGNVRELINRVQRAVVMCDTRLIRPVDLGLERRSSTRALITLDEARAVADRDAIQCALRRTRNNVSRAAEALGVSRVTLYRLMEKYAIEWQRA